MLAISLTTSAHLTTLLAATEVYVCTSLALLNDDLIYIGSLALKVFFKGMLDIRRVIVSYVKKMMSRESQGSDSNQQVPI